MEQKRKTVMVNRLPRTTKRRLDSNSMGPACAAVETALAMVDQAATGFGDNQDRETEMRLYGIARTLKDVQLKMRQVRRRAMLRKGLENDSD